MKDRNTNGSDAFNIIDSSIQLPNIYNTGTISGYELLHR